MTTPPPEKVVEAPAIVVAPPSTDEADRQALGTREALILTSMGQRRINLIWEITQSAIAMSVTIVTLYASARLVVRGTGDEAAFLLLSNAFFLVSGFYFGRTNHQRVGGVGGGEVGR